MRPELYAMVHKALRTRLFDLNVELARCDFADADQLKIARSTYQRTVGFLREHHEHEEKIAEPVFQERCPSLVEANRTQHEEIEAKLARLDGLIAELDAPQAAMRAEIGKRLVRGYDDFLAAYLAHMQHEETVIQKVLWEHFSDEELVGVQGRIQGSIPPARFAEWLEIILPAVNLDERATMLVSIKAKAPEPAFKMACEIAARVLGQTAFAAVRARAQLEA